MKQTLSRTYAAVDTAAVRHNYEIVRSKIKKDCKVLSVIKADAYGHGAVEVARTLKDSDYFGVACLDEALELRENGIETPILILGYTNPREANLLAEQGITQCAFDEAYVKALENELKDEQRLKVHLKLDTGMSRLGFYAHDAASAQAAADRIFALIQETSRIDYEGIFTHFTSSETKEKRETEEQFSCFMKVIDLLEERFVHFPLRHCANSGAILKHPKTHLDMVRAGIILYGYVPDPSLKYFGFRPALEWKAHVSQIHTLKAGDGISYNRAHCAEEDLTVATVCAGYADGLSRKLSNGAPVLINGVKTKILGRVCMDQCIIDVTGICAKPGDPVILIGKSGELSLTADDLAQYIETISYEILCDIGKRVPRIYPHREPIQETEL